ncbi:MAG: DUF5666 domain-containing protein, partial [Halothiobacillus sp.]
MSNHKLIHILGVAAGFALLFFTLCSAQVIGAPGQTDNTLPGGIGGTGAQLGAHPGGGIGGTGIVAIGPIQRFGSIFVLGKEYHFTPQTIFTLDGQPSREQDQQLGDWVTVQGHWDKYRWVADRVDVTHAITGKIESIDRKNHQIHVLGQVIELASDIQIRSEPHPAALHFSALKVGDEVQLSAAQGAVGHWLATGIVRLASSAQPPKVHLQGEIQAISPDRRQLQIQGVWLASQSLIPEPIKPRQPVEVIGSYRDGRAVITQINPLAPSNFSPGQAIALFGYIHQTQQGVYCDRFKIESGSKISGTRQDISAETSGQWRVVSGLIRSPQLIHIDQATPSTKPMQFGLQLGSGRLENPPIPESVPSSAPTQEISQPQFSREQM